MNENSLKQLENNRPRFNSETGKEAAQKSVASRRTYMMVTELAEEVLGETVFTTDPLTGEKAEMTIREKIIRAMAKKAADGDTQAAQLMARWAKEE